MGFIKLCIPKCYQRNANIISEKSLKAVEELVRYLQNNLQDLGGWIFRAGAIVHQETVKRILQALKKGSIETVKRLLAAGWQLEGAQALYLFLSKLKQPLLPESIQALVLGDTGNVPPEVVATDVLGLISQELSLRHLQLITIILRLLNNIIRFSPTDEIRGYTLPLYMLPLFFDIQEMNMNDWRKIAMVFFEVIRRGIETLEPENSVDENEQTTNCNPEESNSNNSSSY